MLQHKHRLLRTLNMVGNTSPTLRPPHGQFSSTTRIFATADFNMLLSTLRQKGQRQEEKVKAQPLKVLTCTSALGFPVSTDCLGEVTAAASCEGLPQVNLAGQSSDHLGPGPSLQTRRSLPWPGGLCHSSPSCLLSQPEQTMAEVEASVVQTRVS